MDRDEPTRDGGADAAAALPAGRPAGRAIVRNWLLAALSPAELVDLLPHLEAVDLSPGQRLGPPHEDIAWVYFPDSGVVSIIKRLRDGTEIEVGTVGSEGMTALAVFLGGSEMPTECVVQIAGAAWRIRAEALQTVTHEGAPLRDVLLCYTQYLFDQVAQSVACDRSHSLEQRCARWLLMTYDRVGSETFELTQEHLASLLGVRRAGVSVAAEALQRVGAIDYSRGKVRILDRGKLLDVACECYATVSADFDRLLGRAGRHRLTLEG